MPNEHMLSTSDNPFNPFTQFNEWYDWDRAHGYHTLDFLARMTITSDESSDADRSLAMERAIDEIMRLNITGNYIRVPDPAVSSATTA